MTALSLHTDVSVATKACRSIRILSVAGMLPTKAQVAVTMITSDCAVLYSRPPVLLAPRLKTVGRHVGSTNYLDFQVRLPERFDYALHGFLRGWLKLSEGISLCAWVTISARSMRSFGIRTLAKILERRAWSIDFLAFLSTGMPKLLRRRPHLRAPQREPS